MDEEIRAELDDLKAHIKELREVQGVHRALISQHQSALKTVAQIMEVNRDVDAAL